MVADIRLTALEKIYEDGFHAVKGIDLEIRDRELMVLVGPSGCGKTTTLRMIAGLEDITSGDIHIGSKRVNDLQPKDRDIAMVFQNYALYPHMTVFDNMSYGLKLRGVAKEVIRQTVNATAQMLGLSDQLAKRPRDLSGGQRQRVALGRAIVRKPQAFLFDEPLSNLDAKLRGDMRFELKTLQQRLSTTTVYVTHDQIEAMTLGDRITVMSQGEIQQVGTPGEVYEHPRNRFVASFIGTPAMNFLTGSLQQSNGVVHFTGEAGLSVALPGLPPSSPHTRSGQVSLGIRPEHIRPARSDEREVAVFAMTIALIESLGDHQYIYLKREGMQQVLIMKCSTTWKAVLGEEIPIAISGGTCHLFAGVDDLALSVPMLPLP
jgi:ABC-type sugar transport system ATPase subunit